MKSVFAAALSRMIPALRFSSGSGFVPTRSDGSYRSLYGGGINQFPDKRENVPYGVVRNHGGVVRNHGVG